MPRSLRARSTRSVSALIVAASAFALAACDEGSSEYEADVDMDAAMAPGATDAGGTEPGGDGDGDGDDDGTPGSTGDGDGDGDDMPPTIGTPLGPGVTFVTVYEGGQAAPGIPVLAHDAQGNLIEWNMSNASGSVAFGDLPDGSMITAPVSPYHHANPSSDARMLTTIQDVEQGDHLHIGLAGAPDLGETIGLADLRVPSNAFDGMAAIEMHAACDEALVDPNDAFETQTEIYGNCLNPQAGVDAVAYALDDQGRRLAYTSRTDVGVSGAAPSLGAEVEFGDWEEQLEHLRFSMRSGSEHAKVRASYQLLDARGMVGEGGSLVDGEHDAFDVIDAEYAYAPGYYASSVFALSAEQDGGDRHLLVRSDTPAANAGDHDLSVEVEAALPAIIDGVALDGDALTYSAPQQWDCAASGQHFPDARIVHLVVSDEHIGADHEWFVFSSADMHQEEVTFPDLPSALNTVPVAFWVDATLEGRELDVSVSLVSDSQLTWNQIRQKSPFADPTRSHGLRNDAVRCVARGTTSLHN